MKVISQPSVQQDVPPASFSREEIRGYFCSSAEMEAGLKIIEIETDEWSPSIQGLFDLS